MKQPTVDVTVQYQQSGKDVGREVKRALNSGIRASEGLVRIVAREFGVMYEGSKPQRHGGLYTRIWSAPGAPTLVATVAERIEP